MEIETPYCLDVGRRLLIWQGKRLRLSPRACCLLSYIAAAQGKVVSKHTLWRHVFDEDVFPRALDVTLCRLRASLHMAEIPDPIETVWGEGLRFASHVTLAGEMPLLVPVDCVDDLRRVLDSCPDADLAEAVRHAIFGV